MNKPTAIRLSDGMYQCSRCKYITKKKQTMARHFNRKFPCKSKNICIPVINNTNNTNNTNNLSNTTNNLSDFTKTELIQLVKSLQDKLNLIHNLSNFNNIKPISVEKKVVEEVQPPVKPVEEEVVEEVQPPVKPVEKVQPPVEEVIEEVKKVKKIKPIKYKKKDIKDKEVKQESNLNLLSIKERNSYIQLKIDYENHKYNRIQDLKNLIQEELQNEILKKNKNMEEDIKEYKNKIKIYEYKGDPQDIIEYNKMADEVNPEEYNIKMVKKCKEYMGSGNYRKYNQYKLLLKQLQDKISKPLTKREIQLMEDKIKPIIIRNYNKNYPIIRPSKELKELSKKIYDLSKNYEEYYYE